MMWKRQRSTSIKLAPGNCCTSGHGAGWQHRLTARNNLSQAGFIRSNDIKSHTYNIKSPESPQFHYPLTQCYKTWEFPTPKRGDERYNSSTNTAFVRKHILSSLNTFFTVLYLQHMNRLPLYFLNQIQIYHWLNSAAKQPTANPLSSH